ncbi:oligoribonuclease [Allohahella sp. A8]|uniref:oligoribonuclease n=1 Tax=Allohahella sp. A8 TaxID=3141461 RepID=UPI003A7FF278
MAMDQAAQGKSGEKLLVWIDLEMTGLDPARDRIIEMAAIVTNSQLEIIEESEVLVVHQSDAVLDGMDEWCQRTHGQNGLTERVRNSRLTETAAEQAMIEFISRHVAKGGSPMCGNSICQDRRFLANYMPALEDYFHYRNLDVSTLKELAGRWRPDILKGFSKRNTHAALDDIRESIAELAWYRDHFIKMEPAG